MFYNFGEIKMKSKKYAVEYSDARTLNATYVGENQSGWLIKGKISEDYYEWVNYFEAFHEDYGVVYGDFEKEVFFSSEEAFAHFLKHHPYEEWDYHDI